MKTIINTILLCICLILNLSTAAQSNLTPEQYAKVKGIPFLTASNGRYQEIFDNPKLKRMGTVMFNTETNKVEYFITKGDTAFEAAYNRSKENSRFLSIDPLTKSFPSLTPYQYASNSPIANIDLDSLEAYFYMLQWNKTAATFQLITHKVIDARIKTFFGTYNANMTDRSFVWGSDGHWHEIPKEWQSKSFSEAGSAKQVMNMVNSWKNGDKAYEGALKGEALQRIGQNAEGALAVIMLADGLTNITANLAKKIKVNIYGEGEAAGYTDIAVNKNFQNGRMMSSEIASGSASEIVINNSPLFADELSEISRMSKSGTKVSYTAPADSPFFSKLGEHLGENATLKNSKSYTQTFEDYSIEMKTVTYEMK
ncbi:MAG: hypothetical protein QM534_10345 [Sediminibacterium sp.]|nr:hypothetical protein [Sediminibacterium sp.]